jgi:hypothetical protein
MTTEKQIAANRRNAQKSTGPRTPEGKAIAAQNSLAHGHLARQAVMVDENLVDFNQLHDAMLKYLTPVGPMETLLAERIIALSWRLKRAGRIETGMFNVMSRKWRTKHSFKDYLDSDPQPIRISPDEMAEQHLTMIQPDAILSCAAMDDLAERNKMSRLLHYERRIERSLYKATLELQKLQFIRQKMNECPDSTPPQPAQQNLPAETAPNILVNPVHSACGEFNPEPVEGPVEPSNIEVPNPSKI